MAKKGQIIIKTETSNDVAALKAIQQLDSKIEDNLNKRKFQELEEHWATVRIGYIREIPIEVKNEIERIYKQEIEPSWLPNKYCKACYFDAIKRLIKFYDL